jgi:plastocyanin
MSDQEQFDASVTRTGKLVLQILAGVGILAALMMSTFALIRSGDSRTTTASAPVAAAKATLPASASAMIDHVTRGCHTLVLPSGASGPSQTFRLAAGGTLHIQDNDVMPHTLIRVSGPPVDFTGAAMRHMGAKSSVTFPTAGTYVLSTKAGEDYMKGITTIGPDNTLHIRVVVGGGATA